METVYWVAIPFCVREHAESCLAAINDELDFVGTVVKSDKHMEAKYAAWSKRTDAHMTEDR
jgi:hypothetical protein